MSQYTFHVSQGYSAPAQPQNNYPGAYYYAKLPLSGPSHVTPTPATVPSKQQEEEWQQDLVILNRTAQLKKHALTLQLHTARIMSAHASIEDRGKAIQDIREQKNKLESERQRLLKCLQEVNEDRDKADLFEATLNKETEELRAKIQSLTDGEYSTAKGEVDKLRKELGQDPMPSLQSQLEERAASFLEDRRRTLNPHEASPAAEGRPKRKRGRPRKEDAEAWTAVSVASAEASSPKRPRGRPRGSKNRY